MVELEISVLCLSSYSMRTAAAGTDWDLDLLTAVDSGGKFEEMSTDLEIESLDFLGDSEIVSEEYKSAEFAFGVSEIEFTVFVFEVGVVSGDGDILEKDLTVMRSSYSNGLVFGEFEDEKSVSDFFAGGLFGLEDYVGALRFFE